MRALLKLFVPEALGHWAAQAHPSRHEARDTSLKTHDTMVVPTAMNLRTAFSVCLAIGLTIGPVSRVVAEDPSATRPTEVPQTATQTGAPQTTPGELRLLPATISLSTTAARQTLVVQEARGDQLLGQVTSEITWQVADARIAKVESGLLIPLANGSSTVTATVGDRVATSMVTVTGQEQPFTWSFRNHVESVLSKTGCNGGACHGARAGQNGFRLTLFGFDLTADHAYLTRQARGRRIVPHDPGRSLLLTKPTGMVPHKGGVRFELDSPAYRLLSEWIAAGAPGPSDGDPVIARVEVVPAQTRQRVGAKQQLVVLAHFSDGHVEDVTPWAKYTSLVSTVASVNDQGQLEVVGPGEGAVKVWYLNTNALAFLSVPFPGSTPSETFQAAPRANFLDEIVLRKLESLNLPPSPRCDDGTFLRRAFLDTMGVLPTIEETRAFLADAAPDKRGRLVDELLGRPELVDYWTQKWCDLLLVNGELLRPKAVQAYHQWIRERVAENTPWDEFVSRIVTASGSTLQNGAANFYALHQSPEEMAETVSQAFLGLSINCAKCHNHPLEKWTNDQYYAFANMFSRVRGKGWGGDFNSDAFEGDRIVFTATTGELIQPGSGRPQPPSPLDAPAIGMDKTDDRRIALAAWLTSPENPYFVRTITNRVWASFFGVGLVEKVDDVRLTNPASNEELLNAAARFLAENRFDLKELMRAILKSEAYQRSSASLPGNQPDERFYSRYYPRRLKAEVLLDAISQVTGSPTEFPNQKKGTRALQLPDSNIDSYFLANFGRPRRVITCECERSDEPSMTQVFHLYNGNTLNSKLQAQDGRLAQAMEGTLTDQQRIEDVYLAALMRLPTESEKQRLLAVFNEPGADRRQVLEDLYWSVLSSREFLFNH